ncbi:MAG: peptidoglycan DD-metalloendopeptidase family protein [Thiogranum sp.]
MSNASVGGWLAWGSWRIWLFAHKGGVARVWLLALGLLSGCASEPVKAPVGDRTERPVRHPDSHRVRQGDTLYSIGFLYGYSVDELVAWNNLRKPYTIYKGQELRLSPPPPPARVEKASPVPAKPAPRASKPKPYVPPSRPRVTPSPKVKARTGSGATTRSLPAAGKHIIWSWPVQGALISKYDAKSAGKKGINIAGKTGDPVRAAAAGKVVYSGSGLSGYGRLIIIKHNKDFLSAYAHNRKLIAREGQWVNKGGIIARMGSSGTDRTQLHFEIRKKGRPVDPLRYLPRR